MLNYNIVSPMNGDYFDVILLAFSDYCDSLPGNWVDYHTHQNYADFIKMYCGA